MTKRHKRSNLNHEDVTLAYNFRRSFYYSMENIAKGKAGIGSGWMVTHMFILRETRVNRSETGVQSRKTFLSPVRLHLLKVS